MAKKDKKKDKQKGSDATEAVEAVRSAIERTFQATTEGAGATQKRTRALVDEIAHAATRVRETIEDVRGLRAEVEALARRVTALENRNAAPSRPAPAKRSTAKSKPAAKTRAKAKSKPRAKRAAVGRS